MEQNDNNIRVIKRAFDILQKLAVSQSSMGPSELAKITYMSKSTVHRILNTLYDLSYVSKNEDNTYTIGPGLFEMLSYHINSLELQTEAKPYLSRLKKEVQLTTHLGVLDGPYVVYIEKTSPNPECRLYTKVGGKSPAYCSSIGKCLLSCLSGDELDAALYEFKFEQFTKNTYTDIKNFKQYLHKVRSQGWAMDNEEYVNGHRCIASPIFDYQGNAIAAIGVSGNTDELPDERIEDIAFHVKKAACDISIKMGYIVL